MKTHILPVFNSKLSIVTVVTAPSKADEIADGLTGYGFEVEKRTLEVEVDDGDDDGSGSESGSDSESDSGR